QQIFEQKKINLLTKNYNMELYYSFSMLIVIASFFMYLNYRFLKLPATIGIMIIAMVVSVFMVICGNSLFPDTLQHFSQLIRDFDFTEVLMGAMLNFLLFAGGIHVNINDLKEQKGPVMIYSTLGVIISTFVVGYGLYLIFPLVGIDLSLL